MAEKVTHIETRICACEGHTHTFEVVIPSHRWMQKYFSEKCKKEQYEINRLREGRKRKKPIRAKKGKTYGNRQTRVEFIREPVKGSYSAYDIQNASPEKVADYVNLILRNKAILAKVGKDEKS